MLERGVPLVGISEQIQERYLACGGCEHETLDGAVKIAV
jgi:hypothetical protein